MSTIAERVKKIIMEKLFTEESEVVPEASFTNDLGADSLDTVEWNSKENSILIFLTSKLKQSPLLERQLPT